MGGGRRRWKKGGGLANDDGETDFFAFDRELFRSAEYRKLTAQEWRVYCLIKAHWWPGDKKEGVCGDNGEICLTYKQAKGIPGLSADSSFSRAIRGLEAKGWIKRERAGGFGQLPNLYRITWTHDKAGSKLDNPCPSRAAMKAIERRQEEVRVTMEVAQEVERAQREAAGKTLEEMLEDLTK